jgi:hypothetical protein
MRPQANTKELKDHQIILPLIGEVRPKHRLRRH